MYVTREAAQAWRQGMEREGWETKATYKHEPIETAVTLRKGPFLAMVILREPLGNSLSVWYRFPSKSSTRAEIGLKPDFEHQPYSWEYLWRLVRTCPVCFAEDVDCFIVGFANSACAKCVAAEQARIEVSGWSN